MQIIDEVCALTVLYIPETANDKGVGVTSAIITGVELLEENVEWRSVTGETCGSGGR